MQPPHAAAGPEPEALLTVHPALEDDREALTRITEVTLVSAARFAAGQALDDEVVVVTAPAGPDRKT